MTYKTFAEWKALGYYVVYGEKSHEKNEQGQCVFSESQVAKKEESVERGAFDGDDIPSQSDLY